MNRFQGDARGAFGLDLRADARAVRTAFMTLCKRYHPAKFARYSPATIRVANEAFLLIRRAHDQLQRDLAAAPVPASRTLSPPAGTPTLPRDRVATPPAGVPVLPRDRSAAPQPATPSQSPPSKPQASSAGTPRKPSAPPPAPAAPSSRGPSLRPQLDPVTPTDTTFERALDHLRARRWAEARPLLSELATAAPADPRFRAYLHYLRGWEAYELGKDAEARSEWRRALSCDPGLGMAQWALGKTGLG